MVAIVFRTDSEGFVGEIEELMVGEALQSPTTLVNVNDWGQSLRKPVLVGASAQD